MGHSPDFVDDATAIDALTCNLLVVFCSLVSLSEQFSRRARLASILVGRAGNLLPCSRHAVHFSLWTQRDHGERWRR